MATLVFEIFSEDIPASMQKHAIESMYKYFIDEFNDNFEKCEISHNLFYGLRRIGFEINDIKDIEHLIVKNEIIRGPRLNSDTESISFFLAKYKLNNVNDLSKNDTHYLYIKKSDALTKIGEILTKMMHNYNWPQSMNWKDYGFSWIRPMHSILALYDDKIIPMSFYHIKSSNLTYGHRKSHILSSDDNNINTMPMIKVLKAEYYVQNLRREYVITSFNTRRAIILNEIKEITEKNSLKMIEDDNLIDEVSCLVEWPHVSMGKIPEKYMSLPKEVLITSLRVHQQFIMLSDLNGNIAPFFIIISDHIYDGNDSKIIYGNEKILKARLEDADFFIQEDKKINLLTRLNMLEKVIFHKEIGNMKEKIYRHMKIAFKIANILDFQDLKKIEDSVLISKSDITTNLVNEFPELQGIAGFYLAKFEGYSEEISIAILEQYFPLSRSDTRIPKSKLGLILALTDRIDTIQEMFNIGIKPTSTKDPYALRRSAISINRIIQAHQINFNELFNEKYNICSKDVMNFIVEKKNNLG